MEIERLKEEVETFLKKENLKLFELSYIKKDNTIQIMLDEKIELDKLEEISNKISDFMDTLEIDLENYLLDVTDVGCERPIRNENEINEAIGEYVYVKTKDDSYTGTLIKYEDNRLYVEYLEKTRKKIATIEYSKVKQLRYAVKF